MNFPEDEAKLKWCPFATLETAVPGVRSADSPRGLYHCIGSNCATWCWADDSQVEGRCGLAGSVDQARRKHR
jgi:hypothetical protein